MIHANARSNDPHPSSTSMPTPTIHTSRTQTIHANDPCQRPASTAHTDHAQLRWIRMLSIYWFSRSHTYVQQKVSKEIGRRHHLEGNSFIQILAIHRFPGSFSIQILADFSIQTLAWGIGQGPEEHPGKTQDSAVKNIVKPTLPSTRFFGSAES